MVNKRDEIKQRLMKQIESMLDDALKSGEQALSLSEIEGLTLTVRHQVGEALLQEMSEQQVSQEGIAIPDCPSCGKRLQLKGKKRRYVRTQSGEIQVERDYYYCSACKRGLFPPG